MLDYVIDLETLDTGPAAKILSIGVACVQDPELIWYTPVSDSEGTVGDATVAWWEQQSADARFAVFDDPETMTEISALLDLQLWLRANPGRVWGNGADFDIVILTSAFQRHGVIIPWAYRNVRCLRTVRAMHDLKIEFLANEIRHHALHDAMAEARSLSTIQELLK